MRLLCQNEEVCAIYAPSLDGKYVRFILAIREYVRITDIFRTKYLYIKFYNLGVCSYDARNFATYN